VAEEAALGLLRVHLSRCLPAERLRAVLWRKTPQELAVPRSWVLQKREPSNPKVQRMVRRDWMGQELSGRLAAMPAPERMTCSCILCRRGTLQEGEGRRRV